MKDYIEILYNKDEKPMEEDMKIEKEEEFEKDSIGPDLLESEIKTAIKQMKDKKAVGVDEIPGELLKKLGVKAERELICLCKQMYNEGQWPNDFTKSIIMTLPKKPNAVECADHRTLSFISHASKIVLKVLTKRIEFKAEYFIGKTQFGFKKGFGTRDAIAVLRMLYERCLEHENDVFVCFVDYEKAFDRVNWKKLMEILKKIGIDWRDRRMISSLYMQQEAIIRVADGESKPAIIGRGVRQGCLLSPIIFSIYVEMIMIEAMEETEVYVRVGGGLPLEIVGERRTLIETITRRKKKWIGHFLRQIGRAHV